MKPILLITLFVVLNFIFISCDKKDEAHYQNGKVELYLLDSYKTIGTTYQIDEYTIVTKSKPLVSYDDFLSYNPSTFSFKISNTAKEAINSLEHSVHGIAFAVKANHELIYTGYFWPSYSSASCDWVVIDPMRLLISNELYVEIGYPGLMEGKIIPDRRNDQRILDLFANDNKLVK